MSDRYYHGGPPGLRGEILPSSRTGVASMADYGAGRVCRRDRVYLTTIPLAAAMFAAGAPSSRPGWVYEVIPVGELEPDVDYDGPAGESVTARRARIRRVHRRLSVGERRARIRRVHRRLSVGERRARIRRVHRRLSVGERRAILRVLTR